MMTNTTTKSNDKDFFDAPSSETDEPLRERIADLLKRIEDECSWVDAALASDHADGVRQHFEEILGWAQAGIDEMDAAK